MLTCTKCANYSRTFAVAKANRQNQAKFPKRIWRPLISYVYENNKIQQNITPPYQNTSLREFIIIIYYNNQKKKRSHTKTETNKQSRKESQEEKEEKQKQSV
eukprot:TRINITY_DN103242_c0_g1_i1.p3 TRINITY_DN103242_c0_g1~~TRINITY_DN103242_c0_g1_i1.p3  ORF type:complete len:102 (+),score=13.19 TRINITY_DN103242_c0_g1_i1:242-547(+)